MVGTQSVIDELEEAMITDFMNVLHSEDTYIDSILDQIDNRLYTLTIVINSIRTLGNKIKVHVTSDFKPGMNCLIIDPSRKVTIDVGNILSTIYIQGSLVQIRLPTLIVDDYVIPYKQLVDVRTSLNGKEYSLVELTDPIVAMDLYKTRFSPEDIPGDVPSNLIHVDFKNKGN